MESYIFEKELMKRKMGLWFPILKAKYYPSDPSGVVTEHKLNVHKMDVWSWTSSQRLMYVQFMPCAQWLARLFFWKIFIWKKRFQDLQELATSENKFCLWIYTTFCFIEQSSIKALYLRSGKYHRHIQNPVNRLR